MRCPALTITLTAITAGLVLGCDGPVNPGGQGTGLPAAPECVATVDGVLAADELAVAEGLPVTYVRNAPGTTVAFDPAPHADADGVLTWDLRDGPEDVRATLAVEAPSGWAAEVAPEAQFAIASTLQWPDLLTLLDVVDGAASRELRAVGLASRDADPASQRTALVYDTPVTTLRAPITIGDAWGGQATFRDAVLSGIPNAGVEDWTFEVVDIADALLPGGTRVRDVLAIRVTTTRTLAVASDLPDNRETVHMLQLFAPCVGEIARAVGTDTELHAVTELRRLVP